MSGVYIKGMEMPKSCYVCPFCDYVSARCDAVKGTPYTPPSRYEERADFCPLVPVPPHGRLIDADALLKEINRLCDRRDAGIITEASCLNAFLREIGYAPTVIPAEEGET